jgi:hypothetical protein
LKAEEIGMRVRVQNKFQTLPFVLEAQNNFARFNASQRATLFKKLFEEEFDVGNLIKAGVIQSHFMLHDSSKGAILNSWRKHRVPLIRSMLGLGDLMSHIEPILLIADYYGEKQGMYFTFLIHHIAMLCIPSFFGLFLWGYHFKLASEWEPEEEGDANSFLDAYFGVLDTIYNYPYLLMLAVWSTIYIESWKRKQNTVSYIWGSQERKVEIQTGEKR